MLREATFASDAAASSAAGPKIMAAKKKNQKLARVSSNTRRVPDGG